METIRFEDLNLSDAVLRAVGDMGFEAASPIQAQAIPAQMEGHDMIGQAQTGTGKTAAFGIPLLQKIDPENKKLQAIVLLPTRELAIQVAEEIRRLAKFMHGIKVLPVYGGQDIVRQIRSLKDGVQVVIGTPGRVMDHMRRKTIRVDHVHTVVLDEADEMLNMGFLEDMETILSQLPSQRQTVMFSATMPPAIADIAKRFQTDPVMVRVVKKELTVPEVTQYYYEVKPKNKVEVLCRLLDLYSPKLSVVFCNTKKGVDELVQALQGRGYFAEGLHGDLKQEQRDRVMNGFRNGRTEILVATDVAARGIDVDDVEAVFNYDIPQDDEYYVHRIGRTGRAGRVGKAFSLVVGKEVYKLRDIQRYCKTKIIPQAIPSLDDITDIKVEKTLDQVREMLESNDLSDMVNIIEQKLMEEDYTALDLAAALLKMSMGEDNEDIIDNFETARSLDDLDSYGRGRYGRDGYGRDRY
ncbi:MAG: DEAD/DEAH box helicase, partial [Lachnospiraceae bacterium]|nr:DEAD/DEAH box helicase [Lachnospiraceae bacterium]